MIGRAVRRARRGDVPRIAGFIRDLARYERLEHVCDVDEARLAEHLFGDEPFCRALLAEEDGVAVGFALFHFVYSTFRTRPCLHLEDLFVAEDRRGRGHGLALLRAVAAEAVRLGCPRLDWAVLDWNETAIRFYAAQGAVLLTDWRACRLEGQALADAARAAPALGPG